MKKTRNGAAKIFLNMESQNGDTVLVELLIHYTHSSRDDINNIYAKMNNKTERYVCTGRDEDMRYVKLKQYL